MPKPNAADVAAFITRNAEIDAAHDRIRAASDNHFFEGPEDVHWGHITVLANQAAAQADHAGDVLWRATGAVIAIHLVSCCSVTGKCAAGSSFAPPGAPTGVRIRYCNLHLHTLSSQHVGGVRPGTHLFRGTLGCPILYGSRACCRSPFSSMPGTSTLRVPR